MVPVSQFFFQKILIPQQKVKQFCVFRVQNIISKIPVLILCRAREEQLRERLAGCEVYAGAQILWMFLSQQCRRQMRSGIFLSNVGKRQRFHADDHSKSRKENANRSKTKVLHQTKQRLHYITERERAHAVGFTDAQYTEK